MQRCIQLAGLGLGSVAPNPMVGAVLAHENKIIGEGWHHLFGGPHAEVNCIASVKPENRHCIEQSTLYVNLEPCSHFGKTPPCADLIIQHRIKHVVVGSVDSNPLVAGKGIARLQSAGVKVTVGVQEHACNELNRRFFTQHTKGRPFVIIKIAQSSDGFMAPDDNRQLWLTNDMAKRLSHKWRSEEQAILVGTHTALTDNPQLTVRLWHGSNPLRILIDRKNSVPDSNKIFSSDAVTWVMNDSLQMESGNIIRKRIDFNQRVPQQILQLLAQHNIQSVIVEGGPFTIQQFLDDKLADEIRLITTPVRLGGGKCTPCFNGMLKDKFSLLSDKVEIWQPSY